MLHEHKIKCNKCGNKLSVEYGHHNIVYINPCEICLKNEKEIIDGQRCVWEHDIEGDWRTGCKAWYAYDYSTEDSFCPSCGKRIEVKDGQ